MPTFEYPLLLWSYEKTAEDGALHYVRIVRNTDTLATAGGRPAVEARIALP
jgi:hypothetical protein